MKITRRYLLPILVGLALVAGALGANAQVRRDVRAFEVQSADTALPVLSPDNLRVVPPTPRVRVQDPRRDDDNGASELRSATERRESALSELRPASSSSRGSSASSRRTAQVRDDDSGDSDSGGAQRSSHSPRRAPGRDADPDGEREYGRLIIMTGFEAVRATIDGEDYPWGSMDGVLLLAGYQYVVVLEAVDAGSGASSTTASNFRTIPVRLRPGETRVLMANLGDSSGASRPPTSSREPRRSSRRSSRDDDDEDDEEIGYLGVSSTPVGTIYIDGDNIGQTTPARRIELDPGRHEVRIFYDSEDRFSETKNVLIRAGVNTNVFFRMRRNRDENTSGEDDED